jgi:hypothetical protein
MSKLYCFDPTGRRRYLAVVPLRLVDRAEATEFENEDLIRAAPLAAQYFATTMHVEMTPPREDATDAVRNP